MDAHELNPTWSDNDKDDSNEAFAQKLYINNPQENPLLEQISLQKENELIINISSHEVKEPDTGNAHVSYTINVYHLKQTHFKSQNNSFTVNRRYNEFLRLNELLVLRNPATVIPPFPEKYRLGKAFNKEIFIGNRFSKEFIEKRKLGLQRFLSRLKKHDSLGREDIFIKFLQNQRWDPKEFEKGEEGLLEGISDNIVNAFAKVKNQDPEFKQIEEHINKYETNMKAIVTSNTNVRLRNCALKNDMSQMDQAVEEFSEIETTLKEPLLLFAKNLRKYSQSFHNSSTNEENVYDSCMYEYTKYLETFKNVLRLRDKKKIDCEELTAYLDKAKSKREKMLNHNSANLGRYIREGYDKFKGIDQEASRKSTITRYNSRIEELTKEIDSSTKLADLFSEKILSESKIFQTIMDDDFFDSALALGNERTKHYKESMQMWQDFLEQIE